MKMRRVGALPTRQAVARLALAALPALGCASGARAGIGLFARGQFIGTYLITIPDDSGGIESRSLLVFFADGAFELIDSNQGGIVDELNPFTDAAGRWTCGRTSGWRRTASAVALDFTQPGTVAQDQMIARLDFYGMTVNYHAGHIEGMATLRFFPLDGDPLHPPPNTEEPFTFEGERVSGNAQVP
jgi:hypothetical protein